MANSGKEALDAIIQQHPGKLVLYLVDKDYSGHQQLCAVIDSLKEVRSVYSDSNSTNVLQDFPQIAFESLEYSLVKDCVKVNAFPCFLCYKVCPLVWCTACS